MVKHTAAGGWQGPSTWANKHLSQQTKKIGIIFTVQRVCVHSITKK